MEAFFYHYVAKPASVALGKPLTFVCALLLAAFFIADRELHTDYVMNCLGAYTGIAALLLLLLLQATQNWNEDDDRKRDVAMHLKLDAQIHNDAKTSDALIGIEDKAGEAIAEVREQVLKPAAAVQQRRTPRPPL